MMKRKVKSGKAEMSFLKFFARTRNFAWKASEDREEVIGSDQKGREIAILHVKTGRGRSGAGGPAHLQGRRSEGPRGSDRE